MDSASNMKSKQILDDFYVRTYETKHEPTQNVSKDPFRSQWEFIIDQTDLAKHIRPHLVDMQITLQAVNNDGETTFKSHDDATANITKIDGGNLTAMVNNSLYSYFSNMKVYLNNELVSDTYGLNHFQCYLYSLLSISQSAMSSISSCWGMFNDKAMNVAADGQNLGFKYRNATIKNGNIFTLRGPVCSALFQQNTPIIASKLKIEFERNSFERMIYSPSEGGLKMKLLDICLFIGYSNVKDVYATKLYKQLLSTPQQYFLHESELNYYRIDDKVITFKHRLFLKTNPTMLLCMFQTTDCFNGEFTSNIFDFKDPGISEICITNEDNTYPLGHSYRFNKTNPSYTVAYKSLHDQLGVDSLNFSLLKNFSVKEVVV